MNPTSNEFLGPHMKKLRTQAGLTQSQVAEALQVTPGYISNVENNRTAMSLRILMYYAKLMNTTLDALVGQIVPQYEPSALDHELLDKITKLTPQQKKKLLKTLEIWEDNEE